MLTDPTYILFRKMLAEKRVEKGFTQVQVADRLRLPQSYVSKYENGERRIDIAEFLHVARALGIHPVEFLQELLRREEKQHVNPNGRL